LRSREEPVKFTQPSTKIGKEEEEFVGLVPSITIDPSLKERFPATYNIDCEEKDREEEGEERSKLPFTIYGVAANDTFVGRITTALPIATQPTPGSHTKSLEGAELDPQRPLAFTRGTPAA